MNSSSLLAFDTDTDTALTWTSSNADVASVDDSGLVTAAPGVTTVTATTANGASVSCVVGVSDQLTYTGLRLDFDEMTTTMYFDSTIDLPGVYLEPYGFAPLRQAQHLRHRRPHLERLRSHHCRLG